MKKKATGKGKVIKDTSKAFAKREASDQKENNPQMYGKKGGKRGK